ncbi:cupin domain-containing protein [uncultured Oscillibacter sp.]|uniref:cupin domain-containing protein n=1 Tax=uncultured Oscillibacter sp. TaxID=876091 RepID=UPI0025D7F5F5|nr:cupin domain-containing protein [uncultured Oscillibacter sp.]
MLIEFDKMEPTIIPRMRGGEKEVAARMYTDPLNKIMRGRLIPGATIGMHTHETGSEIIYILSGKGKILYDDGCEPLEAGSCHYCPKGHAHSLINDSPEGGEDLRFFAVVAEQ